MEYTSHNCKTILEATSTTTQVPQVENIAVTTTEGITTSLPAQPAGTTTVAASAGNASMKTNI